MVRCGSFLFSTILLLSLLVPVQCFAAPPALMESPLEPQPSQFTPPRAPVASARSFPLYLDAGLAFNPVATLISDNGGLGSRVTLTPSVLLSAELRPGFEFFVGTQYTSHGLPVTVAGREMLASNSALEVPMGIGFPLKGTFLGEGSTAIFRTGIMMALPMSNLMAGNQLIANSKFSYSTYFEAGGLFPLNPGVSLGMTMRLNIGLSNAYANNSAGAERTFNYGFVASSRFVL
jgi:hypothetical protein